MPLTSRSRGLRKALSRSVPDAYYNGFATGVAAALLGCVAIVAIAALV